MIDKTESILLCNCGCGSMVGWNKYRKRWNKFIVGHGQIGLKRTEETKKKLRQSHKGMTGRKHTEETKRKMSKTQKGKELSEESKVKLRQLRIGCEPWNKGKVNVYSDETKKQISNSLKLFFKENESCNKGCRKLGSRGYRHTEETKKKMKGRIFSPEHRKKLSYARKGKTTPQETRIKMSCSARGISIEDWDGFYDKEYCCSWSDKEYKDSIKERDDYKCQNLDCWGTAKRLSVHHIDYDKKNCKPSNLIALCASCNTRANYNRPYWQELYSYILKD